MKVNKTLIAALSLLLLAVPVTQAQAIPDAPPLPAQIETQSEADAKVKVIVTLRQQPQGPGGAGANAQAVAEIAEKFRANYGFEINRQFSYLVNAFSGYVAESAVADLRLEPAVAAVEKVRLYYPLMENAAGLTQSDLVRKNRALDGRGIVVSVIDSGVDIHHQDMRLDDDVQPKLTPAPGFNKKVPYGYNFADNNNIVRDTTPSQHGIHVAGIVAANGGKDANIAKNSRINGIAPNAQVLAMKVFSNDPARKGAAGDDVMAAIEESVKHGADIINMSLGSPNGFEGNAVGEQRAIKNARAAGVEVIVAAGNEGLNGSPTGVADDALGMLDDATIGAPATGTDAWAVAAVENSKIVFSAGKATQNGEEFEFGYNLQTGSTDEKEYEIVDAGLGKIDDTLHKNFSGKFLLIQRGEVTFADKFTTAQTAKAAGVIIWNNAENGDNLPGMAGVEKFTFPGAVITHNDGKKLQELIKKGQTKVKLTHAHLLRENPNSLRPSDFTSWGTASELGFKPQIAGIGGNVYSTVNDNKYANESGTSMAAPHVAGVSALMLQKFQQDFPTADRGTLVQKIRHAISNTAMILKHDDVPYAPRQIGAGLVQTENALKTQVFASVAGAETLALREVKGSRSFRVDLQNESASEKVFQVGATCVVNENNSTTDPAKTHCSTTDTIKASVSEVKVPAHGRASVEYTLSVSGADHWTQGWVTFTSQDPAQPNLSLPYLGFAGDWNKERIVDYPAYAGFAKPLLNQENKTITATSLYTQINGGEYTLRDGEQFISPNGDGLADNVYAKVAMLRNAKLMKFAILDEAKNVLREIGQQDEVRRPSLKVQLGNRANDLQTDFSAISFDGKVYDQQQAKFVDLPDGKYFYRIAAQLGQDFAPQILDLPFTIDRVAPQLEVISIQKNPAGNYEIKVKASDDVSGVNAVQGRFTWPASLIAKDTSWEEAKRVDGVHTLEVNGPIADKVGYAEIYVSDYATNVARKTVLLDEQAFILDSEETIKESQVLNTFAVDPNDNLLVQEQKLVLTGRAGVQIAKIKIGAQSVAVSQSGQFEIRADIVEGDNAITVQALDKHGKVLAEKELKFFYDGTAPKIEITDPVGWPKALAKPVDGKVTIRGKVTDNLSQVTEVKIAEQSFSVAQDGTFTAQVPVKPGEVKITVEARDKSWNKGIALVHLAGADPNAHGLDLKANLGFGGGFNVVSGENPNLLPPAAGNAITADLEYTYLYRGIFNRMPKSFFVDGEPVEVHPDGTFETPVKLREGITNLNLRIVDTNDAEIVNSRIKVLLDLHAPNVEFSEPLIHPDGAIYLPQPRQVKFAGTVSDNAFGYNLAINGNVVEQFFNMDDPQREVGKREFTYAAQGAHGDKMLVLLKDQIGNDYLQIIPVIVDQEKPEITLTGLKSGAVIKVADPAATTDAGAQEIKIRVTDPHLAQATVYLDGKPLAVQQTKLVPAPGAFTHIAEGFGKRKAAAKDQESAPVDNKAEVGTAPAETGTASAEAAGENAEQNNAGANAAQGETALEFTVALPKDLTAGAHTLYIEASDKAGNAQTETVNFQIAVLPQNNADQSKNNPPAPHAADPVVPGIDPQDLTPLDQAKPAGWNKWIATIPQLSSDAKLPHDGISHKPQIAATGAQVAPFIALAWFLLAVGVPVLHFSRNQIRKNGRYAPKR